MGSASSNRGHQLGFDEPIAIKVLKMPAAIEGAERERFHLNFLAEGRLLHRLPRAHAGIVQALDVGAAVSPSGIWTPFLVLEWLDGCSLERDLSERRARGDGERSVREAVALLDPAASALAAAHRAFDLDRTEVTVGAYAVCVDAHRCKPAVLHGPFITDGLVARYGTQCAGIDRARPTVAINCVDQLEAAAYCELVGKRLPTEAEWEYAARGTDGREFPRGSEAPTCERSNFALPAGESCGARPRGPIEVGSLPLGKSPFGAVDLVGNVWEWVADGWDSSAYEKSAGADPRVRGGAKQGVLRGGGWDQTASTLRSTNRLAYDSTTGHVGTGFRCARTLE